MTRDKATAKIYNLSQALQESLIALCLEGKKPPYRVPFFIDGDLWHWTTCKTHAKAIATIKDAVAMAADTS